MKILISGASGLIGTELEKSLTLEGHEIWKLVRKEAKQEKKEIFWDPDKQFVNPKSLEGFDAFINLSGENIAQRKWTESFKKKLRESRIRTTSLLAEKINTLENPPKTFLSASAVGFYGNRGSEVLTEESRIGTGFLPELSLEWESAANGARCRVVNLRTGIVLSKNGGAIKKMLIPFKLGLGGKLGSGKQFMSWISLEDEIRAISFCLTHENISGPVNLTAPNPVTNEEFTKTFAKTLRRPAIFNVPAFALRLLLGQMADDALLASANVIPRKIIDSGFSFNNPFLENTLKKIL